MERVQGPYVERGEGAMQKGASIEQAKWDEGGAVTTEGST